MCYCVRNINLSVEFVRNINLSVERFEIEKLDVTDAGMRCNFHACCGGLVCLLVW